MLRGRTRGRSGGNVWYKSASYLLNNVAPSLIHDYVRQRYYNNSSGVTSLPFTSTRTTNAMMLDVSGNLVWAPNSLLLQTALSGGTNGTVGAGAVAPTGWTFINTGGTVTYQTSTIDPSRTAIRFTSSGNRPAIGQNITLNASCTYIYSFRVEAVNSGTLSIGELSNPGSPPAGMTTAHYINGVLGNSNQVAVAGDFVEIVYTLSTTGGSMQFRLGPGASTAATGDVTLSSPNVYIANSASDRGKSWVNVGASAYYGPRFDYYPVIVGASTVPGLLSEESRTNLVTNSLGITTATTTVGGTGPQSNSPSTYLGGWSAVRYASDAASTQHYIYIGSVTPTASASVSISAIVKMVSGRYVQLTGSGNWMIDLNGYANFDCTGSGSITATGASASNAFIYHLGNGVYHIGFDVTSSGTPSSGAGPIISLLSTGLETRLPATTTTDVVDIIYGGVSMGSGWTTPIPTFGTSATRGGDTFTQAVGSWLDTTKGTMYASFMRGFVATGSGTARAFMQIDLDTNNRVVLTSGVSTNSQQRFDVLSGGVSQAQIQTSTGGAAFTTRKTAGLYNTNLFKASENGVSGTDDTTGTVPTGLTSLRSGGWGTTNQIMGWMFEIRYYPDASASSAQLNTLTT